MQHPFLRPFDRLRWPFAGLTIATLLLLLGSVAWPLPLGLLEQHAVVSVRVTDRPGNVLRAVRPDGQGQPIALGAVPPAAVEALVATEDRHFYWHPGIDLLALARAAWQNLQHGAVTSGGSTITMQVARALRGSPPRTLPNKLAEMHLALRLELYLTKSEILALWLNRVPFGNQMYGIEAAAQLYFGKAARDLTPAEATYLIGLPQSPSRYNPFRYPDRARARQLRVLQAMTRAGRLTADERDHLGSLPLDLQPPQRTFRAPHFTEYVLHSVSANQLATLSEIRTTLDPALQQTVEALVRTHLARLDAQGVTNAAVVVLDNATGAVLAYAGSADFWNDRADGQNDGVQMLRQPGSALKPFTYAHVLASRRYTAASILPDLPLQVLDAGGAFSPDNYDRRYHGPVPLRQALACSYNIPAVHLAREMGPPALLATLHKAGFTSLQQPPDHYGVGLTLGNGEVRLLELARSYAGLARGGTLPAVHPVQWVRTTRGDTLRPTLPAVLPRGIMPDVAYLITDILSDPEARAPAFGRGGPLELPFPVAVKTGTSKDYRDNWAVGYTPRHTVAVWAGNFDGTPMRWVSGVSGAGPLLHSIFLALGEAGPFVPPQGLVAARVCPVSGLRPGPYCLATRTERFLPGTAPDDTCRVHRRVALDRRTGLLADAATPLADVDSVLFTVHPPRYHAWMYEHGLPMPPTVTSSAADAVASDSMRYTNRLQVQYPASGTVYQLDPVLRPAFQQIHLRGAADETLQAVRWWVDDEPLAGDYRAATWTLLPGTHYIELRAVDRTGQPLRSPPAIIRVAHLE